MKTCIVCLAEKQDSEFYARKQGGRLSSYCKPCEALIQKEYRRNNREKINARRRADGKGGKNTIRSRKALYGLSEKDFQILFNAQAGGCAVCGVMLKTKGQEPSSLTIDHDHDTGKVRGILCGACNRGLGFFKDSLPHVKLAVAYLERHEIAEKKIVVGIKELMRVAHSTAKEKGWWDEVRNDGEIIALMHSELSEALEYARKGNPPSDHIPEFSGVEEELADLVIRICDFSAARGYRLAEAIIAKMEYNKSRPHKHGKNF